MKKNKYGDVLNRMADTTKQAVSNLSELTGESGDRELRMYNRLKPIDFDRLVQMHGTEAVGQYIDEMETRRLKENYHGI